ncbi:hypothetical protein BGW42_004656 [Actinomortierella wolfii]|nr:hypothetical protein BGW42_004656 [Actinomortierella wolfii]
MDPTRKHTILQGWKNRVYQPCVDKLIDSCLDNIHVFTPSSASNTIATVKTLDQFLLKLAATLSPVPSESKAAETTVSRAELGPSDPRVSDQASRETCSRRMYQPISILMIDSLSAFYWQERPQNNYSSFIVQLDRALQHLRTRWGLIVLYTTWSLHPSPEILYPESWRSKVKFRFTIAPKLLDCIPAHVDLVSLWRKQFEDWTEQAQRAQMVAKEPWQIPFMANRSETQHPPKNHPNARQESSSSEIDFEWDDVDDSNIGPKNQAKHLDDLDTARASYFQVQMAHPQPAHGRPWEIFRFSVSDVSGVQFFHIPC